MFISCNSKGGYDVDAEYRRGQSDGADGEYDPPSRDPVTALAEAWVNEEDSFRAAERAYEAGYRDGKNG